MLTEQISKHDEPFEPFLWGVATSPYQSEGGYNGPGEPQTNWASSEGRGQVMKTGLASEFWTRFPEDFARCRAMGLNAFRLGMEWSRLCAMRRGHRRILMTGRWITMRECLQSAGGRGWSRW